MSHSYVAQFHHLVFGVKERLGMITPEVQRLLPAYAGGILRSMRSRLIQAGGMSDHQHLLVELHATVSVAQCIQKLKSNTSRWIKRKFPRQAKFSWQEGYGAFSVSRSQLPTVKKYIASQADHHKKMTFSREVELLLRAHGMDPGWNADKE